MNQVRNTYWFYSATICCFLKLSHITLLSDHMESLHLGPYCIKTQILHQRRQMGLHHNNQPVFFYVLLTVHLSILISVINQLDAQKFCFTVSSFHASTCFEHMCSSSGGQNCITQPLVSSHLQVAVWCTG